MGQNDIRFTSHVLRQTSSVSGGKGKKKILPNTVKR